MLMNVNKARVTKLHCVKILLGRLRAFVLTGYWVIQTQKAATIQIVARQKMTAHKVLFATRTIVRTHVKITKYAVVMQFALFNGMKFNANAH